MNLRRRIAFTGRLHSDGTWEIRPEWGHLFRWEAVHFVLCWLVGLPHLVTVDPNCGVWFVRRWLVRLALGKWRLQVNWHHYPNEALQGESFGAHCHPLHAASLVLCGGYTHSRLDDMRRLGAPARQWLWVQTVRPWQGWRMHQDDGHRVECMEGGTRSLFFMWGRDKGWYFLQSETRGSSRVLRHTRAVDNAS